MEALTDALAEVFASLFGPDPIEYRAEHGLLDFHEEMGALIQEVIGVRVGKYFSQPMPAYRSALMNFVGRPGFNTMMD